MSKERKQSTEAAVREIRRRTRRKFSPEEKIRIVLEGLRGESDENANSFLKMEILDSMDVIERTRTAGSEAVIVSRGLR